MAHNSVQMRSLFVGNIPKDLKAPEELLANMFGKVGLVLSVKLCRDVSSHKSLGHAYVNFQNVADAERAQQQLNYAELPDYPGRELRVAFSERDPNVRTRGKTLFVKNIDTSMSNKQLQELFIQYGVVIDCAQATDSQGNKLGFGSVQFAEDAAADKAMAELNGKSINGKELVIAVKEREEDKTFTKIFVRGIKADATDDEIRVELGQHAKPVGAVASIIVSVNPINGTRSAIIDLGDHEAAVKAVEVLNDKKHAVLSPGEAPITAAPYRKPAEKRLHMPSIYQNDGRNLYVKYLPDHMTEEALKSLFEQYGVVESVSLATVGGVFRGFAFVCFKKKEDADRAVTNLHRHSIFDRPLYVQYAQHHDQRQQFVTEQIRGFSMNHNNMMMMGGGAPANMMMGGGPRVGPFTNPMMYRQGPPMVMGGMGGQPPHHHRGGFGGPQRNNFNNFNHYNNNNHGPMMGGGYRGPMNNQHLRPNRQHHVAQQQQQQQQNSNGISPAVLVGKSAEEQKNILGERLYMNVTAIDADRAAKITGMLLELPTDEIIAAINDSNILNAKVTEAQNILAQHS